MSEAFDSETPHGEARGLPLRVPGVSLRDGADERRVREVASALDEVVRLQVEVEDVERRFLAHDGSDDHIELKGQMPQLLIK